MNIYIFLDYFFILFHTAWTVFNLTGWIWQKTRKIHLITMTLTAISWFILGIWYGWGYCLCTDWHWQIRYKLGKPIESYNYIHFLILEITNINLNPQLVDHLTMITFAILIIITITINGKKYFFHIHNIE